ncbi:helix-turn-helix domain-containing protein [Streptomyces sp. NPDC088810]|uniref:nSTAND1 domain-containing NTPase n=1 Tax=Streptomyces sp. NPDC088810 TaxID=3365904 RepID=UPI0037F54086
MAGRREVPVDPAAGPVQRFAQELRKLRQEAGGLTYRVMAHRVEYSVTTLSQAAAGQKLPSLEVLLAYVRACDGDEDEWRERWRKAAAQAAAASGEGGATDPPPYRGLARFETVHAKLFFGREGLTGRLVDMARNRRFTAVFGPSGSGKSSLLRAGLIPRLREGDDSALRPAAIRVLTPGEHPVGTHASRLNPVPDTDAETWLIVDQFEELFTLCRDTTERTDFIERLLAAAAPGSRLRVVAAVRADFYAHCLEHPGLTAALRDATVPVGQMSREELRQAIVRPAAASGLVVERSLTARLLDEIEGEPGALPMLSHALLETWHHRTGRTLTEAAYEAAGTLHGAIAKTAEDVYSRFTESEAGTARRLLLRLVTPGDGTPDTRRPAERAELQATSGQETPQVLQALSAARLLTFDNDAVDLAHEALLTAWPRLRGWIETDRERLRAHRKLTEAARAWEELGRDAGALYRGTLLDTAQEHFASESAEDLTDLEQDFLTACITGREQEEHLAVRTMRRLRALTATLSVLLVLAVTASLLAWQQSRDSDRQRQKADAERQTALSRQLAAQSAALINTNSDLAALLAIHAYRSSPTTQAVESLYAATTIPLRHRLTGTHGSVVSVTFRSDGRLLTADDDGTVHLWEPPTGQLRKTFPDSVYVPAVFSPDGRTVAITDRAGGLTLWDTRTGRARKRLTASDTSPAAFSADGHTLATSDRTDSLTLWDTRTGRHRFSLPAGSSMSWAFSSDSRTLATGDNAGGVTLWDTRTGRSRQTLPSHASPVSALAFSPDGHALATSSAGTGLELWDTDTGHRRKTLDAYTAPVASMAFSPDGRTLATGSNDHVVRLWDANTGRLRSSLTGHTGAVLAMAFSPDGRTLATGSADRSIRLWDTPAEQSRILFSEHSKKAASMVFSPDGRTVATSSSGHQAVQLWDADTGRLRTALPWPGKTGALPALALSPDGHILATSSPARGVELWDADTGRFQKSLVSYIGEPFTLKFSPDGRVLATSSFARGVDLWEVATGRLRSSLTGPKVAVPALAFSPDGHTLATGSAEGTVRLWGARSGEPGRALTGHTGAVLAMAYSPDGRTLATGGEDRTIRLWDPTTGSNRSSIPGHTAPVLAVGFSPDGRTLATGGEDRTIRLWDPTTGSKRITFSELTSAVSTFVFSPDSHALTSISDDSTIRVSNVALPTPGTAINKLCRALDRNLTRQERRMYLPDQPARAACPHQARRRPHR